MKNIFRILLVVGVLLFLNTHPALADSASFSATSTIRFGAASLPPGISFAFQGPGAFPTPSPNPPPSGSGQITTSGPAVQSLGQGPNIKVIFADLSGHAGPGPGSVSITQTAVSSLLTFSNSTDNALTVTIDWDVTALLQTQVVGDAAAAAELEFDIYEMRENGGTTSRVHQSFSVTNSAAAHFDIVVPARGTMSVFLAGTQRGLAEVPEPATMVLLGTGLAGVTAAVRKKRKRKG